MTELIITSSVLILTIVALRLLLRKRISAGLQYGLWVLVALRLLLPFSLFQSPVSVMNLLPDSPALIQREATPPPQSQPTTIPDSPATPPSATVNPKEPGFDFAKLAMGIWLGGTAACGIFFLAVNLHMSRKLQKNRIPLSLPIRKIPGYQVEGLPSPCLYGFWKPAIYLTPESTADHARLRHILAHEETHYRHKDHLWAVLRVFCVCLHWYNPLVWLAAALSRWDSELACDESTLARLGDESRIAYGKTLIEMMIAPRKPADLFCCATTMGSGKKELAERLRRIAKKPRLLAVMAAFVLVASVAAVAVTFGSAVKTPSPADFTYAEQLWNARTQSVENTADVEALLSLLPEPEGLQYDRFEQQLEQITIIYQTNEQMRNYYSGADQQPRLQRYTLLLFALVDDVESVVITLEDGENPYSVVYTRDWADAATNGDVRSFGKSHQLLKELMEMPVTNEFTYMEAMEKVEQHYPNPMSVQDTGNVTMVDGAEAYSFEVYLPMTQSDSTEQSLQLLHIINVIKGTGDLWEYDIDTDQWTQITSNSEQVVNLETSYRTTYVSKNGDNIALSALTDEKLAKEIIMDMLVKYAVWPGGDATEQEEYFQIEMAFPHVNEKSDYYAYLLDGRAVLQSGRNGMYSYLSDNLYDQLYHRFAIAMEHTTDVLHNLSDDTAITLKASELYTNGFQTDNGGIQVSVSETTLPVTVTISHMDSKSDLLETFVFEDGNNSHTFKGLSADGSYFITALGDRNAAVTISEAS